MAKIDEPTVKVKLEPDTADFDAKLAAYQERARKAMLLPADLLGARIEALNAALAIHSQAGASRYTAEDVVATAGKLNDFLLGAPAKPQVCGGTAISVHSGAVAGDIRESGKTFAQYQSEHPSLR